ncbi:hypothetical protein [Pseudolactococcus reticulitermitis]
MMKSVPSEMMPSLKAPKELVEKTKKLVREELEKIEKEGRKEDDIEKKK